MTAATPLELYRSGRLTDAIAAATELVRARPTDGESRALLAGLQMFRGEWERADKHLDVLVQQDPNAAIGVHVWRQLMRAEVARQQVFQEGRVPELIGSPTPAIEACLRAAIAIREGQLDEAGTLLAEAEASRPKLRGQCDGKPFDDFRDLDDLTAPVLEVVANTGKYFWIPFEQIASVTLGRIESLQDRIWRPATLRMKKEWEGNVFVSALYPLTGAAGDDALRLGRAVKWLESTAGVVRGCGLKSFLVGSECLGLTEFQTLEFQEAS